ncbi:MAG: hypothetical protein BWK73_37460 [Thiothrix lacustris]|uniref:DUF1353 domain-containing protein n=1 Tax=Thiothrix lacustris TaxID=525917 RepID=A0A1Y1QF00_9GAMM|nr:MAG: hypothetical protein BWK73_37460 [Thiothrix lacustris]
MEKLLEQKISASKKKIISQTKAKELGLLPELGGQEVIERILMAVDEELSSGRQPEDDVVKFRDLFNLSDGQYRQFKRGRFHNIDKINLNHKQDSWWEYIPDTNNPFSFERHTGEIIQPGKIYTDGGSIPGFLQWIDGLKPWDYGLAYMIHDWEFDAHHCNLINKRFEDVRDTMMEAVKTMMEDGLGEKRLYMFTKIFDGIDSLVARSLWKHGECVLPQ